MIKTLEFLLNFWALVLIFLIAIWAENSEKKCKDCYWYSPKGKDSFGDYGECIKNYNWGKKCFVNADKTYSCWTDPKPKEIQAQRRERERS